MGSFLLYVKDWLSAARKVQEQGIGVYPLGEATPNEAFIREVASGIEDTNENPLFDFSDQLESIFSIAPSSPERDARLLPPSSAEGSPSGIVEGPLQEEHIESGIERKGKNTEQSNASVSIGNNAFQWTSEEERQKFEDLAFEQAKQSRIVNTDDIRPLLPGYEQADPLIRDAQYHPASRDITTRVVERMRAEPVGTGKVLILAGGRGSGKSTGLSMLPLNSLDFILDTTLSHLPSAKKLIAAIQASGREAEIVYVHRPFQKAFEGIVDRYLLGKKKGEGRIVPLDVAMNAHIGAQETIFGLKDVSIRVFDNDGDLGVGKEITLDDLSAKTYIKSDERDRQGSNAPADDSGVEQSSRGNREGDGRASGRAEAKARLRAEGERILRERYEEGLLTEEEIDAFLGRYRVSSNPLLKQGNLLEQESGGQRERHNDDLSSESKSARREGVFTSDPEATRLSVEEKLDRYLLNSEHPIGGAKARWFKEALGFTRANSDELVKQLAFDSTKAVQTSVMEYGVKLNQLIEVLGANGRKIPVKVAWIRNHDGVVRLVTAVPGD